MQKENHYTELLIEYQKEFNQINKHLTLQLF